MTSHEERHTHYDQFVTHVRDLCTSPRIRRTLETGRGRPTEECEALHAYLARPCAGHPGRRAHYTVAALIALERPTPPPATEPTGTDTLWNRRRNLGTTLAHAAQHNPTRAAPIRDRLEALSHLSQDLLHPYLPGVIRHLLQDGHTPDWALLIEDLTQWPYGQERVAGRWKDSFYLGLPNNLYEEL